MSSEGSLRAGQPVAPAGIESIAIASRPYVAVFAVVVGILVIWQGLRATLSLPACKLPDAWDIVTEFASTAPSGQLVILSLAHDLLVTWIEAAFGFVVGAAAGFVVAVISTQSRLLERGLLPYVIMSQTIPILAVAPHSVNLSVQPGVFISPIGPSGCGKSSLLRIGCGRLQRSDGAVTLP